MSLPGEFDKFPTIAACSKSLKTNYDETNQIDQHRTPNLPTCLLNFCLIRKSLFVSGGDLLIAFKLVFSLFVSGGCFDRLLAGFQLLGCSAYIRSQRSFNKTREKL